jgi:hypothetical protein
VETAGDEARLGRVKEILTGLFAPLGTGEPHCHTITIRVPAVFKYYWYFDAASMSMSRPEAW